MTGGETAPVTVKLINSADMYRLHHTYHWCGFFFCAFAVLCLTAVLRNVLFEAGRAGSQVHERGEPGL